MASFDTPLTLLGYPANYQYMDDSALGWYHIDAEWSLYIDGQLQQVHVDYIHVDEHATDNEYVVDHYDRTGNSLCRLTLASDDIEPELQGREPTNRPAHI